MCDDQEFECRVNPMLEGLEGKKDKAGGGKVDVEGTMDGDDDEDASAGVSNSTGHTRGIVCTLVISLTRVQ